MVDSISLGWWMLMILLYSSRGGHGKVGMVDVYADAV